MSPSAVCPICEAVVICGEDVLESEVLTCRDCLSSVVVESRSGSDVLLSPAPQVEEDWGE